MDLSRIQAPPRAEALDAYDVFVGDWTWEATMANADEAHRNWTGSAKWEWSLDRRVLHGTMTASSGDVSFQASGDWSWHPTRGRYIWWMISNWGYPQHGTARFNPDSRSWVMDYRSVGLDGTTSFGRYTMTEAGRDRLDWTLDEWADPLRLIRKMTMTGTYTRR